MTWRDTLMVRAFGWTQVPMIAYLRPKVVAATDDMVEVRIRLGRRSRNHLRSMYFGALAVGADLAGGFLALRRIKASGRAVSFVFKDVRGEFLRRPTGDVHFTCADGDRIRSLVDRAVATGERQETEVAVVCTVPSESDAPVARFWLTLSLKEKGKKGRQSA